VQFLAEVHFDSSNTLRRGIRATYRAELDRHRIQLRRLARQL
jgi:hypothetical protein